MSIWYTIVALGSFMLIMLLWGLFTGVASDSEDIDDPTVQVLSLLAALLLWLAFLLWLLVGLIRTAWKWEHDRLGIRIFRYLQIGFFVGFALTLPFQVELREYFRSLLVALMVFDVVIAVMIVNFLLIAWFARCRIPLHAYWEIGSIVAMIVVQIWIFT